MNRFDILDATLRAICGDRQQDYGEPADSLRAVGELWKTFLRERCVSEGADICIEPEDVAVMMCLLKIARIATGRIKADNWIDLAGYAALGGELATSLLTE